MNFNNFLATIQKNKSLNKFNLTISYLIFDREKEAIILFY